jgi:hypothetical protein
MVYEAYTESRWGRCDAIIGILEAEDVRAKHI